jgi:hypothetical protein
VRSAVVWKILKVFVLAAEAMNLLKRAYFYGKPFDASRMAVLEREMSDALGGYNAPPRTYLHPQVLKSLNETNARVVHGIIGHATESGELVEHLLGVVEVGKTITRQDMVEELGDAQWYTGLMLSGLNTTYIEVWTGNIAKLRVRYPDQFSEERAEMGARNIEEEKRALGSTADQV